MGDTNPAQDESPPGLHMGVSGTVDEPSEVTLWLSVGLDGSPTRATLNLTVPGPGTYSLESLAGSATMTTFTSADADAGGGTRHVVQAKGTLVVYSAAATGCTEEFNSANMIVGACARTLTLGLNLSPSSEYPVSGTFSIDLLTKLVVTGTTSALSCVD
jgi:hypothetical protein